MDLYTSNALDCSIKTTRNYSTSFSLGVRVLGREFRPAVYAIYGFVRFADEIVDTFHNHDRRWLLNTFREQTYQAIELGLSTNPILHSFQWVVNKYAIDRDLIDAFLESMEMDLEKKAYTAKEYQKYIYGSAEVVGLMCLKVFCYGKEQEYQRLLPSARKLGEAFQKVNFLRDMKSDLYERGRVYFPEVDFDGFDDKVKKEIEKDIKADFDDALKGIRSLDKKARLGVYLAYRYYLELLGKISRHSSSSLIQSRIRVDDRVKLVLLIKCIIRNHLGWIK